MTSGLLDEDRVVLFNINVPELSYHQDNATHAAQDLVSATDDAPNEDSAHRNEGTEGLLTEPLSEPVSEALVAAGAVPETHLMSDSE